MMRAAAMTVYARIPLRNRAAWWASLASVAGLLLVGRLGFVAVLIFIAGWALMVLAWPRHAADSLVRSWLPWGYPLFALASTIWSQAPDASSKGGAEFMLTTGIAILMARSISVEKYLSAWTCALVPIIMFAGVVGGTQYTETGELAVTGIFGSKNNFALHICLMLFASAAVLADPRYRRSLRILAFVGLLVGPALLWRAKSVGALVVFFPSLMLMLAVVALGRIRAQLRPLALIGTLTFVLLAAAIIVPMAMSSQDMLLNLVGKSGDLTGRGYLWYRAGFLIQQQPTLGSGYWAFWIQGNVEAEGLWRVEHITGRGGFHFHSFYYETLVELGYAGMAIAGGSMGIAAIAVLLWALRSPSPQSGFFCALTLFLFMRSFVELDLTGGFGVTVLVFPAAWCYATSALGSPRRIAARWLMPQPAAVGPSARRWDTG